MDLRSFASTSTSLESTLSSSVDESHSECEEPSQPSNHVAHTTNFEKLVDLVVSCGGDTLTYFLANMAKNAVYTSHIAVVESYLLLSLWRLWVHGHTSRIWLNNQRRT